MTDLRAQLVSDLHNRKTVSGSVAHQSAQLAEDCSSCHEVVDEALAVVAAAGWLDRLTAVEPVPDVDAIIWGGRRWIQVDSRPDLDPVTELSVVMNAVGWALYGEDGRERSSKDDSIQLSEAEMETCAAVAEQVLMHLAVLRSRASIDPAGALVIADEP